MDQLSVSIVTLLNRLERTNVKYIYSTVIFIIFLYVITFAINFNYVHEVENVDLSKNDISKISVDLIDTNIALSTTVDKDIKIEHIYSKEQEPTSNIYSYQEGNTLIIKEYPYNRQNLVTKKETVNIYIPEEYDFELLNIKTNNGQINVDSLQAGTLNVVTNSGNVDIANINATNMAITGTRSGVNVSNVVAKKFESTVDKMAMKISNSIIDKVKTNSDGISTLNITGLVTNQVNIGGSQVNVDLFLNQVLDYEFKTSATIGNPALKQVEQGYEYKENSAKNVIVYNIPDASIVNVVLESIEDETKEKEVTDE